MTRRKQAEELLIASQDRIAGIINSAMDALITVGEEFPIEASISQLEIKGQKLYTVIPRDITVRKKTEERLREQAALLNQTQEAIIVNDLEGHILFWNRGAESLYGWMAEEVIGGSLAGQAYRDEESHKNAAQVLSSKGVWKGELRQYTKGGKEIIVEGHWTLINDDEGKPKSILRRLLRNRLSPHRI